MTCCQKVSHNEREHQTSSTFSVKLVLVDPGFYYFPWLDSLENKVIFCDADALFLFSFISSFILKVFVIILYN